MYGIDNVCLLAAVYVSIIMLICALSLAMNIFVLNIYHRSPHENDMPKWVRLFISIRSVHARRVIGLNNYRVC